MKKSQIVTISIIVFVILIFVVLVLFSNGKIVSNPTEKIVNNIEEKNNSEILGNKEDLISFSIIPGQKVSGIQEVSGVIKGGYFFEGNILINILDANKNVLKSSNAVAQGDWMTAGPVNFEGNIDFTGLPIGPAYFEIHNDNPSDLRENDKSILIPIIVE
ncbi:MAG: Gmad2 immunoglobulin-like domain-containing protein [Candidatus Paceibacterota bacterium]|jgi:hypothetical protein